MDCRNKDWIGKNNPNYNHKWNDELKKKASGIVKEQFKKGRIVWNKNLTKEDEREFNNTKFFRENNPAKRKDVKLKISNANRGHLLGDLNPAKKEENRYKITLGLKKAYKEGRKIIPSLERNSMWKGGLSFEPYTTDWTNQLRNSIRNRDNPTCQVCGKSLINKKLDVHHIDYNKKNCNPDNLITLCKNCHSKTNQNRGKWKIFFLKIRAIPNVKERHYLLPTSP